MARESTKTLRAEIEELRLRLEEAQQALDAIRTGQVESLVVEGKDGPRIFSIEDANHSYRALVEAMSEGAATLAEDGAILYCNARFARMLGTPLERVMGGSLRDFAPDGSRSSLDLLLLQAREGEARGELHLRAEDGQEVPVQLSASTLHEEGRRVLCVVATDLREQKQNRQVLAEGQLARSVLEQAADAIVVCDEKGRITRASRTAEQLCGCCPLRAHFDSAFPVVLASPLLGGNLIANALRGAILRAEPATLTRVDGSQADLLVSATPLQAAEGRIIGCVITMVDVSEHRRADEALRESETRFRSVLEDSRDVIYRVNLQTGHYDYISPSVEAVLGYSPGALLAMDVETSQAMIHPDDMPAMQAAVARLHTTGEADVEYRQRAKHGDYRWLSNHMSLVKDSSGRPLYRNGNVRDITENKQAEEALRESEQRHRLLADTMLQGVVHQDGQGAIISMNFAAERILGKTRQDFLGSSSVQEEHHCIREDGSPFPGLEHPSMVALRTGKPIRDLVMGVFNPRESAYRWISIEAVPLFRPGEENPYQVYTFFADVTERKQAEDALRAGRTLLNSVLDSSLSGIMAFKSIRDAQGRITDFEWQLCNATAERMVGRRATDLVGRRLLAEMPGNRSDGLFDKYLAVVETGRPLHHEHHYEHEGLKTWFDTSAVQLGDGFAVTFSDITNRKRTEETLEGSKQRLAEVLNSIQDDFYVLDRDWRFTFASKQFTSRIGKTPEDFLGNSIWEMFPKHVGTAYEEHLHAAMDRKETRRFEIGGKYTDAWYQMTVFPSEEGVTVLGRETTENKKMEEALRASERLYRAIGESIDYGVWVCAPDGRNTYASQSFLDLVGLTQEQCSNFGWGEVLHPDDAERTIAAWKECVRTGGAWDIEHRFRGVDGKWHPILARGLPVKDERGEITCWVGINLDISALKQTEEALREADRRKNEFLATLSHELRNPLAPIRNSAYVLERCEPGSEQAKRALAVVNRQAAQLAHLVDDLLDVTRITRNKIQLQRQTLDLNELVRQAVEDQRAVFDQADVRVDLHPAAQPVSVNADRNRLAQIIGNLLQNAAKFTGRGGRARITVSADATEQRAVIQVADTGAGMTPEMIARLFQPFSQADSTLDRSKGGLGLGLALTKGLVELHGGDITARSAGLDQGAEFIVRLPLAMDEAPAPQPTEHIRKGRRRVLVIEDNIDVADSLRDILAFGEHEVEVAYNGPQGLAKAEEFRPDIVFCDIGLPIMNGYEVARAFLANDVLKHTFLVALSGYAMPEDLERASAAGFKRHLAKPPNPEKLEEVLNEAP